MADALATSYKRFVDGSAAAITGGWITPLANSSLLRVTLKRSQKDALLNKSRPSIQSYVVEGSTNSWTPLPPTPLDPSTTIISGAPSGRFYAIARKDSPADAGEGAKSRTILELWSCESGSVLRTIHVDSKVHGDIIADSWFGAGDGGLNWSPDERMVVYVAEAPPKETAGFLDPSPPPAINGSGGVKEGPIRGGQFDYASKESWGERYETVRSPKLYVAQWAHGIVTPVPVGDTDDVTITAGQPVWAPVTPPVTGATGTSSGSGGSDHHGHARHVIAFVGWPVKTNGRRLGMVYCYNRKCGIYAVDVTVLLRDAAQAAAAASATTSTQPAAAAAAVPPSRPGVPPCAPVCLTPSDVIARSPRFSPDGSTLAYLTMRGPARYLHNGASELAILPWRQWYTDDGGGQLLFGAPDRNTVQPADANAITIVPSVEAPKGGAAGMPYPSCFPSLYTHLLPPSCWSGDSSSLWLTSVWGYRHAVLRVDLPVTVPFENRGGGGRSIKAAHVEVETAASDMAPRLPRQQPQQQQPTEPPYQPLSSAVLTVCPLPEAEFGSGAVALLTVSSTPVHPESHGLVIARSSGGSGSGGGFLKAVWGGGRSQRAQALPCPIVHSPWPASHHDVTPSAAFVDTLKRLNWRVLRVAPLEGKEAQQQFEAQLLWPSSSSSSPSALPLVLVPHGGPHSAFTSEWIGPYAWLASQGYAVLTINYRGSLGYGEAATSSLPGRAGASDVSDCYAAAMTALALGGSGEVTSTADVIDTLGQKPLPVRLDPSRVSVIGGSHGGCLAAHLVGQFPGLIKAAVMRNPVTNM